MPISIADLQGLANELSEDGSTEAKLRASVSRSYYAAFHALMPLAELLPPSSDARPNAKKITHHELESRLLEWLGSEESAVPAHRELRRQIAGTLQAARAARVKADYRLDLDLTAGDAQSQYHRARKLIRKVEEVLAPAPSLVSQVPSVGQ